MKKYIIKLVLSLFLAAGLTGCGNDFLNVLPSTSVSTAQAFSSIETAQLALTGVYTCFHDTPPAISHTAINYLYFVPDVMGEDALVSTLGNYNRFVDVYGYYVIPTYTSSRDPWRNFYSMIANANGIIDNIGSLPESSERDRIEGEALCLRAYAYHYLVRLYAKPVKRFPNNPGVILRLSQTTEGLPRATVREVYDQIISDVERAVTLLPLNNTSKTTIDQRAAHAILARLYLDLGDATNGISHAQSAVNGLTLMGTDTYTNNFCRVNSETIWAFIATPDNVITYLSIPSFWFYARGRDAAGTFLNVQSGYSSFRISRNLIDKFETGDVRLTQFPWDYLVNDYLQFTASYPTSRTGYLTSKIFSTGALGIGWINFIRGSEMYLIIAELAADNGNFANARTALNTVRNARGLADFAGADGALVDEIQLERRRELFAEGFRAFDIKRRGVPMNRLDGVGGAGLPLDGHDLWAASPTNRYLPADSDFLEFPIPQEEIDSNDQLTAADQNPAYR